MTLLCLALVCSGAGRSAKGVVTDQEGRPLAGAVVQIENTRTLLVRSYVTWNDGEFEFHGLNPDTDYELRALYRDRSSSKKTLSRFDSRPVAAVDLKVQVGQ